MLDSRTVKSLGDIRRELVHASQAFELALVNGSPRIHECAAHLQEVAERYSLKAARLMQVYDGKQKS